MRNLKMVGLKIRDSNPGPLECEVGVLTSTRWWVVSTERKETHTQVWEQVNRKVAGNIALTKGKGSCKFIMNGSC